MAKNDIKIENNTAIWEMRSEGTINGTYAGTFRFRCFLTPLQQIAAGREYRDLLGLNAPLAPQHESTLAWSLCQLKQRIISAPPFWNAQNNELGIAGDLPDEDIIVQILDAAIMAEDKYKEQLKKRKEEALKLAREAGESVINRKDKKAPRREEDGD